MHLYRAEGMQRKKATQNWATTREYAQQFGGNVIERDIPVDNILAVNVGNGNYHEVIVGKPPQTSAPRFSAVPLPANIEQANTTLFTEPPKRSFFGTMADFFLGAPSQQRTYNITGGGSITLTGWQRTLTSARISMVDKNAFVELMEKLKNNRTLATLNFRLPTNPQQRSLHLTAVRRT